MATFSFLILLVACAWYIPTSAYPLPAPRLSLGDVPFRLRDANATIGNSLDEIIANVAASDDPLLTVKTSTGTFAGAYNATSGVYHWLGVPYAADTGGANRFKAPTERVVQDADAPQDATKYGLTCPQYLTSGSKMAGGFAGIVVPPNQGEDCLSANVWVGKNVRSNTDNGAGAPVMLFLYGGSFTCKCRATCDTRRARGQPADKRTLCRGRHKQPSYRW